MIQQATPLAHLANELSATHTLEERLQLQLACQRIEVRSNSAELIAKLRHYYSPFCASDAKRADIVVEAIESPPWQPLFPLHAKQPDPGKSKIKEEFIDLPDGRIIRKRLTGMVFLISANRHLAYGPCINNDNQLINFINNRQIQAQLHRGALLFHAAAISFINSEDKRPHGAAICGFSGAGKSTLALHIMQHGATFISNDRLLVVATKELQMVGVAKLPRINPGTIVTTPMLEKMIPASDRHNFLNMPEEELWQLEQKYDLFIDQIYGKNRFELEATMDLLIILNWSFRSSEPFNCSEIEIADRPDLYPAFMKSPGLFYESESDDDLSDLSKDAYTRALQRCRVFELTGKVDFDTASLIVADLLSSSRD